MNVPDPRIFSRSLAGPRPAERAGHLNLVYHGTMVERLGVDLIRAVAQLQDRQPCARRHLWGHGDDLAEFQRLAHELKVENRVLFEPRDSAAGTARSPAHDGCRGVIGNRRSVVCDLMLPVKLLEYVARSYRLSFRG